MKQTTRITAGTTVKLLYGKYAGCLGAVIADEDDMGHVQVLLDCLSRALFWTANDLEVVDE